MADQLHLPEPAHEGGEAEADEQHDGEEPALVGAGPAVARGGAAPPHPYLRRTRPRSAATTRGTTTAATVAVSRHCTTTAARSTGCAHRQGPQHAHPLDDHRRPERHQGDAGRGDRALEAGPPGEGAGDGVGQCLHAQVGRPGWHHVEQPPGGEPDRRPGHRAAQQRPPDDQHEHEVGHEGDVAGAEGDDEQHGHQDRQAPQQRRDRRAHPVPVATGRGVPRPAVSTTATTSSVVVSTAGVTVPVGAT